MKLIKTLLRSAPAVLLLASVGSLQAAPTDPCIDVPQSTTLAALIQNGGCTLGDKQYTGFNTVGLDPDEVGVQFNILAGSEYQLVFAQSGGFSADFSLNYTISVMGSPDVITAADVQGNYPFRDGASVLTTTIGPAVFVSTPASADPAAQTVGALTSVSVSNVFDFGNETLGEVSNAVIQSTIPEPGTYALMGSALLGLTMLRRKRS